MPLKAKHIPQTEYDRVKYEVALELGLLSKISANGWQSLTAKETGKIGGLVGQRMHQKRK